MKRVLLTGVLFLALATSAQAQIAVPFSFVNGQTADADSVNTNFSAIAGAALNRTGGILTGNLTVNAGVTIDGIDLSAVLGGTGNPTFTTVTATGAISASTLAATSTGASSLDVGGGINVGTGNVALVDTTGKISGISATYFASLDASALTGLNASQLTTGTVAVARGGLGASFAASPQGNLLYFSGTGVPASLAVGTAGQFLRTGGAGANPTWSNDGSNLTGLNASNLASGTLPDARLVGTYSNTLTFSGAARFTGTIQVPSLGLTATGNGWNPGNNNPAITPGVAYAVVTMQLSDGSTVYFPVWK